jgi:Flp pilus assembly protein TadG
MMRQGTALFRALYARRIARITPAGFRRVKADEGSSLVEFALIFLVMMAMMLGIIDFCRAAYVYHFVSNAAREATRYAAVRGSTCNVDSSCSQATPDTGPASPAQGNTVVQDYVVSIVPPGIDASGTGCGGSACLTTTPTWPVQANGPTSCSTAGHENDPGCTVKVTVSYSFSFIFPIVYRPFSSTGTLTLSSSSEMIIVH